MTSKAYELKNAYIGEYGWKPWSNTVAYYPLTATTTVNDQSGNSRNLTNTNVTFWTNQWVSCASFNWTDSKLNYSSFYNLSQWDYAINLRAYKLTQTQNDAYIVDMWTHSSSYKGQSLVVEYDNNRLRFAFWYDDCDASVNPSNQWTNICCQYKKSTNEQFLYVNWVLNNSRTATNTHLLQNLNLCICGNVISTSQINYCWKWYLSNLIFENKLWTATEVQNYYNKTKSNYWF